MAALMQNLGKDLCPTIMDRPEEPLYAYRWQDRTGRGPYRPGFSRFWADPGHNDRNPASIEEFPMHRILWETKEGEHIGSAFRNPDQMRRWFTATERQRLLILGYTFNRVIIHRVLAESQRQLVVASWHPFNSRCQVVDGR